MRGFAWFCGLFGLATWLDTAYCDGRYTNAFARMVAELALHMHLIG